jgi:Cysteine sulfinate desulfinase/cysteine desulfurase and related enzymes
MNIYLDNCASTQVSQEAAQAMYAAMTNNYANPSALHTAGQEAERLVKQGRSQVAFWLGTKPANIVFTSGGTEANNLAIFSVFDFCLRDNNTTRQSKFLISAVEHPSVYKVADSLVSHGVDVMTIPVLSAKSDFPGMVDVSELRKMLSDDVELVSILHVNNEIGTIQPIDEISRIIKLHNEEHGTKIRLHVDAVQSYGKIAFDVESGDFQDIDFVSISAHKIHGPKGIGALYSSSPEKLHPIMHGGGQENGIRSGTENVPGIVGFGMAARTSSSDIVSHAKQANVCRRRLLNGILEEIPNVFVNSPADASITGKAGNSSPYILNVSFPGARGEVLVHELEKDSIFVSTGAACASIGKEAKTERGTLAAMGVKGEIAEGALRFGFSRLNTTDQMDFVLNRLKAAVERFRRTGSYR